MLRRQLLRVLGLLVPPLATASVASAGKRGHARPTGIAVQSASYDPDSGVLTTTVRWHKGELRRDGRDELHLVVFNDGDTPRVLRNFTVSATADQPTRTYRLKLNNKQRREAGDGSSLTVVATHKHAVDGGLFDRVWHHRLPVNAAVRDASPDCGLIAQDANLSGCYLAGADLSYADLAGADLSYANLVNADLSYTNLSYARLTGADLFWVNLTGTILCGTTMSDGSVNSDNC